MNNERPSKNAKLLGEILITAGYNFYMIEGVEFDDILTAFMSSTVTMVHHNIKPEKVGDILDQVIDRLIDHRNTFLKDDQL